MSNGSTPDPAVVERRARADLSPHVDQAARLARQLAETTALSGADSAMVVAAALALSSTTTEWGVRHSQGMVYEEYGRPFTEAKARALAAEFIAREPRMQPEARGQVRLVSREVTEWREVGA